MLLSIIIPVYNLEEYIGRCLDSCLSQKLNGGYEIICVNDGSKDNSLAILREYESKYPNIHVIDKPNGGVSSARNAGIRAAKGDYIWFIDGDDWIADGSCETIEKAMSACEKKVDCVLFGFKLLDDFEKHSVSLQNSRFEVSDSPHISFKQDFLASNLVTRWFKTHIAKEHNLLFNETLKYSEDLLFVVSFNMYCSSMLTVDMIPYFYYQRPGSAMHVLDNVKHCNAMLRLAYAYKKMGEGFTDSQFLKRTNKSFIRSMQAACIDLCIYCGEKKVIKHLFDVLRKNGMYPFGVDSKQFRRDKKQGLKSDMINWFFGFLSCEPYFWICWMMCGLLFKSKRTVKFDIADFEDTLNLISKEYNICCFQ